MAPRTTCMFFGLAALALTYISVVDAVENHGEEVLLLRDRLDRLEKLLLGQDSLGSQQSQRLFLQDNLLLAQAEQLSRQQSLLQAQAERLAEQESAIGKLTKTVDSLQKHAVNKRSDDTGALGVAIGQMGQELAQVTAEVQALKSQVNRDAQSLIHTSSQQAQSIQDARTSTFVHWGSSRCSNDTSQLVYSGVMGGSRYSHSGAATNYLCLTLSPVPSQHPVPRLAAYLYGTEYETEDSHYQTDAVCAVCRASYSSTIMIPGTNTCSQGWTRQYSGFLMANLYNSAAGSEFICVDSVLESRTSSVRNDDGNLLYFTVAQCGALPCPPYLDGKIVTCVVCSL